MLHTETEIEFLSRNSISFSFHLELAAARSRKCHSVRRKSWCTMGETVFPCKCIICIKMLSYVGIAQQFCWIWRRNCLDKNGLKIYIIIYSEMALHVLLLIHAVSRTNVVQNNLNSNLKYFTTNSNWMAQISLQFHKLENFVEVFTCLWDYECAVVGYVWLSEMRMSFFNGPKAKRWRIISLWTLTPPPFLRCCCCCQSVWW